MKRITLVMAVAAVLVAMLVALAAPAAMAKGNGDGGGSGDGQSGGKHSGGGNPGVNRSSGAHNNPGGNNFLATDRNDGGVRVGDRDDRAFRGGFDRGFFVTDFDNFDNGDIDFDDDVDFDIDRSPFLARPIFTSNFDSCWFWNGRTWVWVC